MSSTWEDVEKTTWSYQRDTAHDALASCNVDVSASDVEEFQSVDEVF